MLKKVMDGIARASERTKALSRAGLCFIKKRLTGGKAGGYIALAALLAMLGAGTYAFRSGGAATKSEPIQPQRAALAMQNVIPAPEPTPEPELWDWPVAGEILGAYSEAPVWSDTLEQWQSHTAIDIAASPGEAVYACREGVVSDAWNDRLWGNVIVLDHGDGWQSMYAGLNTLNLVCVGESVAKGDIISAVAPGVPCESELAPHIHFTLTKDGDPVDLRTVMKENTL